jgi:DNA adenine methylase
MAKEVPTNKMKIKALAPWFGGKRNLAKRIVELLGEHQVYWEPFCGSMAVLLAKPKCRMETVNDLHQDLINLARVIKDRKKCMELYRMLRHTLFCEDFVREANEFIYNRQFEPNIERAYWYFLHSWIGRNGNAGCKDHNQQFCRRYTSGGGSPETRFQSTIKSIPAWRRRLSGVAILNMDAFEMLERIEDKDNGVIYVDPPYWKNRDRYKYDFEEEDHIRLAELLHRFNKVRIVLSYYDDPRLSELYPSWEQHKIEVSKAIAHQGQRGTNKIKATEVLLCNHKIENRKAYLFEAPAASGRSQ